MDFGKIEYVVVKAGNGGGATVPLKLTLIGQGDEEVLRKEGIAALRRRRILRIAHEAERQGFSLCFKDLSGLLFTSLATIKRDIRELEAEGVRVPLKGRRRNGNGAGKLHAGGSA